MGHLLLPVFSKNATEVSPEFFLKYTQNERAESPVCLKRAIDCTEYPMTEINYLTLKLHVNILGKYI